MNINYHFIFICPNLLTIKFQIAANHHKPSYQNFKKKGFNETRVNSVRVIALVSRNHLLKCLLPWLQLTKENKNAWVRVFKRKLKNNSVTEKLKAD